MAAVGILLSAWYVLTMLQRVFFQSHREPPALGPLPAADLTRHETYSIGGLAVFCLFLGLFPQLVIKPMKADVAVLHTVGELARDVERVGEPKRPLPKQSVPQPRTKTD
jgi:NADH-quinone oxidoreductase subunit M